MLEPLGHASNGATATRLHHYGVIKSLPAHSQYIRRQAHSLRVREHSLAARLESQGNMIESFRAYIPKSLPSASRALRGGMLASALLAIVLLVAFRATAPSPTATQMQINQPATAFTLPAEQAGVRLPAPATFTPASGKPTLLVFFYTLCTHCLLQMQSTHAVTTGFPSLRTVYIDSPSELPNLPDLMMQRLAITDLVLLDADGRVAARYGSPIIPHWR